MYMLAELIQEETVLPGLEARDWEDAVRKAADPLVANGSVSSDYVDDIVDGARECGPYFVLVPHVAIPHARPERGARRPALGVALLGEPVEFGSMANDPVKYIFTLSMPSTDGHIEALRGLVECLSQPGFYRRLDAARDARCVIECFADFEQGGDNV
jgi:PTS system ascorbate-specific IIA component